MRDLLGFTVVGIVTASVYAIAASGLVVTYTTSGVFNIAHGAIGMLMAFAYWELRVNRGWPAPLALIAIVLVGAPLLGAALERILMRGLAGASTGTSLVVTVGVLVGSMGLAQALWPPDRGRQLRGFFEPGGFSVARIFVSWHQALTTLTALVVAAVLFALLSRTRIGVAMRAVVDDRALAALNGARPGRIAALAWALGAALAALAGILLAPVLQLNIPVLTLLVVNAYAAAMLGRLRNLPLTFAGAVALGLGEAYAVGYVPLEGAFHGLRPALPTLMLFAILLLMPEGRLFAGRRPSSRAPRVASLRHSVSGAGALVVAAVVVGSLLSGHDVQRVGQGLAYGLVMLSLVPLTGYGGQVSLCQMTFAGVGAFAMARFGGGGSLVGLVAAIVFAAAFGAIVSLPAARLHGLYLALMTMAFAVLMDNWFFPDPKIFGTFGALPVPRLRVAGLSFDGERSYLVLLALAFGVLGVVVLGLRRGLFGRLLQATADSPVATSTLGASIAATKLAVFTLSAGMAGLAGALYGGLRGTAGPTDFLMFQSLPVLLMAVIGGVTTVSGALVGGMLLALLPLVQQRIPALGGLAFLVIGAAAVSLGRNPHGIAFALAERLRAIVDRWRPAAGVEEVRLGAPAA